MPQPIVLLEPVDEFLMTCQRTRSDDCLPLSDRSAISFLDRREVRGRAFCLFNHSCLLPSLVRGCMSAVQLVRPSPWTRFIGSRYANRRGGELSEGVAKSADIFCVRDRLRSRCDLSGVRRNRTVVSGVGGKDSDE